MQTLRSGFLALTFVGLAWPGAGLWGEIIVTPDRASGIYEPGDKVVWTVTGGPGDPVSLVYTVKKDGQAMLARVARSPKNCKACTLMW